MFTINQKHQPYLEMNPNKPFYFNIKAQIQPLQIVRNKAKEYERTTIDYEEDVLRKKLISRSNRIRDQAMLKLSYENALLQAELAKYQNKCQLAQNQLMYQCLAIKTTEYQQLINKMKELPSLKTDHHNHRYSRSLNMREHGQSLNVSYQEDIVKTDPKQQIDEPEQHQKLKKASKTMALVQEIINQQDNIGRPFESQKLQFSNKMEVFGKPQTNLIRAVESEVQLAFEVGENDRKIEQSPETKRRIKKNMRVWRIIVWFIMGAHAFLNTLKLKKKRKQLILKQKYNVALKYKQEIKSLHQKNFQSQIYDWVSSVIAKVVTTLKKGLFLDDFNKMLKLGYEHKLFIDFRRSNIVTIAKFMFESLLLASNPTHFPTILQKHMILHLFKGYNQKPSLFVSLRTQYFTKGLNDLSLKEQQMIATEYFLFSLFIPNILQCFNSLKYESPHHEIECKMLVKIVISLIQIQFMSLYKNIPQQKQMSVKQVVQLNLIEMNDEMQQLELNIVNEVDHQDQQIIKGLFQQSFFTQLIQERKKIQYQLKELMKQITNNISAILGEHLQSKKQQCVQ